MKNDAHFMKLSEGFCDVPEMESSRVGPKDLIKMRRSCNGKGVTTGVTWSSLESIDAVEAFLQARTASWQAASVSFDAR